MNGRKEMPIRSAHHFRPAMHNDDDESRLTYAE